ncbi:ATP-grasp domain-containing protein [Burkholderia cepacia]|uniref:ATP-grasp domain-containing protein n=1 Tax=Burkholderia cepacia TaxID=292 RepID=UPI002AB75BD3|nr:ATP-grasp domain-containing protein [Burkholderia cepacia]
MEVIRKIGGNAGAWAIVDGYSSGKHYAKLLNAQGIDVYHVQSMKEILEFDRKNFYAEDYKFNYVNYGDYDGLLSELKEVANLSFVVPGCETGVELADRLSEDLGLHSNGRCKSDARRDKFAMAKALEAAGLRHAKTFLVNEIVSLNERIDELGLPVVVKPCASAGSDDVYICRDRESALDAFNKIHLKVNTLGVLNKSVLIQKLLRGRQYIVNTVSYRGHHYAVEVWEDNREDVGSAFIYNYEFLLLEYGELEKCLIEYTCEVLTALGVNYGPSHVELMVDEGVPTLIEIGARPAGGIQQQVMEDAQCYSHVSAVINCFLNDGLMIGYENKMGCKHVVSASLISRRSGFLKQVRCIERVEKLTSFQCLVGLPSLGSFVPVTRDLETSPGILMLSHSSRRQILDDLEIFRAIERESLFDLE